MGLYFNKIGGNTFCGIAQGGFFRGAPKKKICQSEFKKNLECAYLMGSVNTLLVLREELMRAIEESWTLEEVQGAIEVMLEDSWNETCRTKVGIGHFQKVSIDEITSSKDASVVLFKKSRNVYIGTRP